VKSPFLRVNEKRLKSGVKNRFLFEILNYWSKQTTKKGSLGFQRRGAATFHPKNKYE
jgi:hypothetical protein